MAQSRKELLEARRWSESEARRVLDEARRSGLSLAAFAERHGLVPERLYRWARKLGAGHEVPARAAFAEVTVAARSSEVEIALGSGRVVRVSSGIQPEALRRLLDVIEGAHPC